MPPHQATTDTKQQEQTENCTDALIQPIMQTSLMTARVFKANSIWDRYRATLKLALGNRNNNRRSWWSFHYPIATRIAQLTGRICKFLFIRAGGN